MKYEHQKPGVLTILLYLGAVLLPLLVLMYGAIFGWPELASRGGVW
jgi:hypothetical protein